jgi:HEAT repeat protein
MGILKWFSKQSHNRQAAREKKISELIQKLNDSNDFSERQKATEALSMVGKPAVKQLLDAAEHTPTKWGAITALGDIGDERAVDCLIKATRSVDPQIRGAAVISLGKIGGERVVETLINILENEEGTFIRQFAIEALGNIRDRRAIVSLTKAVDDSSLKKYAQIALDKIK